MVIVVVFTMLVGTVVVIRIMMMIRIVMVAIIMDPVLRTCIKWMETPLKGRALVAVRVMKMCEGINLAKIQQGHTQSQN